ncbi:putative transposon modulator protein [Erwinia amylovora ATCC 49946]|nr:putative transposon modulator protein [Erwinia amylovora ATCC 49946]
MTQLVLAKSQAKEALSINNTYPINQLNFTKRQCKLWVNVRCSNVNAFLCLSAKPVSWSAFFTKVLTCYNKFDAGQSDVNLPHHDSCCYCCVAVKTVSIRPFRHFCGMQDLS